MTGAGWTEIQGSDIGFTGTFWPWAVDFDARGRIYIANNAGSGSDVVIRINNMNDSACDTLGTGAGSGIVSVAVDRARNYVYYASSSAINPLKRCELSGANNVNLPISGTESISTISGMDIDSNGILYISGTNTLGQPRIFRYDTVLQSVTASYSTYLDNPSDVEVRFPYIYVANADGLDNYKILQLSADLQFIAGYGLRSSPCGEHQSKHVLRSLPLRWHKKRRLDHNR